MKILLITDNHATDGGGAEKSFFDLKNALKQRENLYVHSLGFGPEALAGADFTVLKETPSTLLRLWWRMFFNPLQYRRMRAIIEKMNPDIIHLHNIKKYTLSILKAVRGYPVIQTAHDFSAVCPTGWNVHRNLEPCETGFRLRCALKHQRDHSTFVYAGMVYAFLRMKKSLQKTVKHVMAPSPLLTRYLENNDLSPSTYLPPLHAEKITFGFEKIKAHHFLYVGQLGKHKGVDTLIHEFALALQKNNNLILNIAGKGSEEIRLKQLVKKLDLQNHILFLGWIKPAPLYEESMALIFPSIGLESFGLVITEAMSYARPVIGSDRGPTSWLVDDKKTGLLFDPLKPGNLAEKILMLADNQHLVKQYGEQGFEKLQGFMQNQEIIDNTIALYKSSL